MKESFLGLTPTSPLPLFGVRVCYVAQSGLELVILLPLSPKYWDYKHAPPHWARTPTFLKLLISAFDLNHSFNILLHGYKALVTAETAVRKTKQTEVLHSWRQMKHVLEVNAVGQTQECWGD
jgi:hypothetical protein